MNNSVTMSERRFCKKRCAMCLLIILVILICFFDLSICRMALTSLFTLRFKASSTLWRLAINGPHPWIRQANAQLEGLEIRSEKTVNSTVY